MSSQIVELRLSWNRATWAAMQFKGTPEAEKFAFLAQLAGNEYVAALVAAWAPVCELGSAACGDELHTCETLGCAKQFCAGHGNTDEVNECEDCTAKRHRSELLSMFGTADTKAIRAIVKAGEDEKALAAERES